MKTPGRGQIKKWTNDDVTKWFLERLALKAREMDSVRNIDQESRNLENIILARKYAVEIIQDTMGEVYEIGDFNEILDEKSEGPAYRMFEKIKQQEW